MTHLCKRALALILTIILVFGIAPMTSFAAQTQYNDTSGHWASAALERWSDYGVLSGYTGMSRPDDPITRAEMAAVLQRVSGYTVTGENPFSDVTADKWYYSDMLKLAAAGIMTGYGGKARPEDNITREEAATLMSRAFDMHDSVADPKPFGDMANISTWAADSVRGLHTAGYITGKPGNVFDPKANITRAEVVTILDNMVKGFYNAPGEYGGNVAGNAVIRADGVTLKDVQISRDLYLTEGIGGDAALDQVTVVETTHIRGGGPNSIRVTGGDLGAVEMNSLTNTHLILSPDTKATEIIILNSGTITCDGITVAFDAAAGSLTLGGMIDKTVLNADDSMTVTAGGLTYEIIPPEGKVTTLTLSAGSIVKELNLNAALHITGTGQIDKINIHANGCVIDGGVNIKLENIVVDKGIAVTVDGKAYMGAGGALAAGGSGGGGGDNPTPVPDPNKATVSFQTNGGSAIAPIVLTRGTTLPSVPMPVKENCTFVGWYTDQTLINAFYSDTPIEKDIALYADYAAQNANMRVYVNPEKYVGDCEPQYTVTILSPVALDEANLSDYIEFTSYTAEFPPLQLTGSGGVYTLTPKAPYYTAGAMYKLSLKDEQLRFDDEDEAVRSLSFRIHKDEIQNIEFKDGIIDILWADVNDLGNGAYTIPSTKYGSLAEKFDNKAAEDIITARFWDGDDGDSENISYHNIVLVEDLGGGLLLLATEDSGIDDVFDDFELYLEQGIPFDDIQNSLNLDKIANDVKNGEGAAQIAAILNAALAESPTLQALLTDEVEPPLQAMAAVNGLTPLEPYGSYFRENTLTGPHTPDALKYLTGVTKLAVDDLEVTVDVYGTDMANFGNVYDSNSMWPMLEITLKYKAVMAGKVQVEAEVKLRENFAVSIQGWNEKSGARVDFDYAMNFYSETDLELSVLVKSVDEPDEGSYEINITDEIEKIFGDAAEDGGAASILKNVLGDKGDDITLVEVQMFEFPVPIKVAGVEVCRFTFTVDFVAKANFAAGIASDMTLLFSRQVGVSGSTKGPKLDTYDYELSGNNRYDIEAYAAGYLGLKAGFKGSVDFSVLGLRDLGKIGASLELGAYADLYGFVHARIVKAYPQDFVSSGKKQSEFSGALYMEVGIYLETALFAESEAFNAKAEATVFEQKFPLFDYGDRYVLSRFINNEKTVLLRADSLPIKGGYGMFDAEFIDMTTGEIIQGNYGDPSNFTIRFSNNNFYVENGEIKVNRSKIGPTTVRLDATADIYYDGGALSFGGGSTTIWNIDGNPVTYRTPRVVKLTWIDPSIDLSQYPDIDMRTAEYYLLMNGVETKLDEREVLFGEVPGGPNVLGSIWGWDVTGKSLLGLTQGGEISGFENDFNQPILKDTVYKIFITPYQRLVSFITFHDGQWHFDVYAVNSGEKPVIPEGYDTPAPEKTFAGWSVYGVSGYTQGNNYLADAKPLEAVYAYGNDYIYSGLNTAAPLHSVSGTYEECWNAWCNGSYRSVTFNRQSLALYEGAYKNQTYDVTFVYPAIAGHSKWEFSASFDHGQKITPYPYIANYAGCELLGWDADSDGAADYTTDALPMAKGNMTLTAVMKEKTFKVTVLDWDNKPLSEPLEVGFGDLPSFPSMPDATNGNRQPTHWEVSTDGGKSFAIWNQWDYPGVYEDWTIRPTYNDQRVITFAYVDDISKTRTVSLSPGTYDISDYVDATQTGYMSGGKKYVFFAWRLGSDDLSDTFTVADQDLRIFAKYREDLAPDTTYRVTFRTEYGELSKGALTYGVLSPDGKTYTFTWPDDGYADAANAFIAINSALGPVYTAAMFYTFGGWGSPSIDEPSRTAQYTAEWSSAPREFIVIFDAGEGRFTHTTSPITSNWSYGTYDLSQLINDAVKDAAEGNVYRFTGWVDQTGKTYDGTETITITGDITLTAQYEVAERQVYAVYVSSGDGNFAEDGTSGEKIYQGYFGEETGIPQFVDPIGREDGNGHYEFTGWSDEFPPTFGETGWDWYWHEILGVWVLTINAQYERVDD